MNEQIEKLLEDMRGFTKLKKVLDEKFLLSLSKTIRNTLPTLQSAIDLVKEENPDSHIMSSIIGTEDTDIIVDAFMTALSIGQLPNLAPATIGRFLMTQVTDQEAANMIVLVELKNLSEENILASKNARDILNSEQFKTYKFVSTAMQNVQASVLHDEGMGSLTKDEPTEEDCKKCELEIICPNSKLKAKSDANHIN